MAVTQIAGGDGTSTSGMTTSAGSGFTAGSGVFSATSYAAASAVSVGGSVGGLGAACAVWGRLAGFSESSAHRLYVGAPANNAITGNHYYAQVTFTAAHLRDYITISKYVSGSPSALSPVANTFVSSEKIYFKRGKLTTADSLGLIWADGELIVMMHDADEGQFLYMGKVVDATITAAGYCGLYLGTDTNGKWDDIWTGTIPLKWVSGDASGYLGILGNDASAGTKAAPYREIRKGVSAMAAGGIAFIDKGNYGRCSSSFDSTTFQKGPNDYNPTLVLYYHAKQATINYGGGDAGVGFAGSASSLVDARLCWIGIRRTGGGGEGLFLSGLASKIRIQECEIDNNINHGIHTAYSSDLGSYSFDTWFIDLDVHHNGIATTPNNAHGLYTVRSGERFEYCRIFSNSNANGFGHQLQPQPLVSGIPRADGVIIRWNRYWGNGPAATSTRGELFVSYAINTQIYGNVFHRSNGSGLTLSGNTGQRVGSAAVVDNTSIFNNIFWNNYGDGIRVGPGSGTATLPVVTNTSIKNNVIANNASGIVFDATRGAQDNGVNNTGNTYAFCLFSDPGFTDPDHADPVLADFRLAAGSGAAYDAGDDLSGTMGTDPDGNPVIPPLEIGAFMWVEAASTPTDPLLGVPADLTMTILVDRVLGVGFTANDLNDPAQTLTLDVVVSGASFLTQG